MKRIRANAFAGATGKLLVVANQILLIPLFLSQWGPEYYGEWLLISAIPTLLAMSNVGLGTAASTYIVLAVGNKDEREANDACYSAMVATFIVSIVMVVASCIIPLEWTGSEGWQFLSEPRVVLLCMVATLATGLITQSFEGYWISRNLASSCMFLRTGLSMALLFVSASILILGGRAVEMALGQLIVTAGWNVVYGIATLRRIDRTAGYQFRWRLVRSLMSTGVGFQFGPLWQAILFQGSLWVAQMLFGPVGVTTWGTLRTLSRSGSQMVLLVNQSVMPELMNAIAAKESAVARRIHSASVAMCVAVAFAAGIALAIAGHAMYEIWTVGELAVPRLVWPMLAIGMVPNSIWCTSAMVHRAYNKPWFVNSHGVVYAGFSLVAMALLGWLCGMTGLVMGYLLFDFLMAVVVVKRSLILLDDELKSALHRGFNDELSKIIRRRFGPKYS